MYRQMYSDITWPFSQISHRRRGGAVSVEHKDRPQPAMSMRLRVVYWRLEKVELRGKLVKGLCSTGEVGPVVHANGVFKIGDEMSSRLRVRVV